MDVPDPRVLFFYRLLAGAGYLDDDLVAEDELAPDLPSPWFQRICVDAELCTGCFACRTSCPASAIRMWNDRAHIVDPAACLSCVGTPCVTACPTGALSDRAPQPPGA